MKDFFNKTSVGFIFRFGLFIMLAFGVLFTVNFYLINTADVQTAKPASVNN